MKLFKKPNPRVKTRLGPHTRKVLSEKRLGVRKKKHDNKSRFTSENKNCVLWLETNFDLLQYNLVVRPYVIKKHNLDNDGLLDVLTYLFPIQYFTRKDFLLLPVPKYVKNNFAQLIKKGYIEIHTKGVKSTVYTTSKKTQTIVKEYYYYLSGRKKIKTTKSFKTPKEQKQEDLLKQLKNQAKSNPDRYKNFIIDRY